MNSLIFEGPDGAGKSTLIRRVMQAVPVTRYVHHGTYRGIENVYRMYLQPMIDASAPPVPKTGYALVTDRSWLAEPIYGTVMRGGVNRIEPWHCDVLETIFANSGGVVVLCLPPVETCIENWNARRECEYPEEAEQISLLWYAYAAAAAKWIARGLRVVTYNYTADASNGVGIMDELAMLRREK